MRHRVSECECHGECEVRCLESTERGGPQAEDEDKSGVTPKVGKDQADGLGVSFFTLGLPR